VREVAGAKCCLPRGGFCTGLTQTACRSHSPHRSRPAARVEQGQTRPPSRQGSAQKVAAVGRSSRPQGGTRPFPKVSGLYRTGLARLTGPPRRTGRAARRTMAAPLAQRPALQLALLALLGLLASSWAQDTGRTAALNEPTCAIGRGVGQLVCNTMSVSSLPLLAPPSHACCSPPAGIAEIYSAIYVDERYDVRTRL
jgi:hypothetical protein